MHNRLTNLLPEMSARSLRRQYFLRLIAVALGMLTLLIIAHAFLLVPTYLYARDQAAQSRAALAAQGGGTESLEEKEVQVRTKTLASTTAALAALDALPTASAAIRNVLATPHPGVMLTGFTFSAPQAKQAAKLGVTGIAASRDQLQQYVTALSQLPFVDTADLPISAYAKERDIPFTVTISGTLMP